MQPHDVRRLLRQRRLAVVHPGVYVNHTGPLTWTSRSWAAVLSLEPAALCAESVVNSSGDVIHVAVDETRKPADRVGVRIHRLRDFDARVQWNLGPPRIRFEDAALTLCSQARDRIAALALASDLCRRRRTTPERLLTELNRRPTLRHHAWLRDVLQETAVGVRSPLESSYVRKVERAHGLPRGRRQLHERTSDGTVYRDVLYEAQALLVELDGRIGHELSRERWNDMDRDLLAATKALMTLRVGWRQAEEQACRTAGRISQVLSARGWQGKPRRCGPHCTIEPATVRVGATG
jgi:hypothetical protein